MQWYILLAIYVQGSSQKKKKILYMFKLFVHLRNTPFFLSNLIQGKMDKYIYISNHIFI